MPLVRQNEDEDATEKLHFYKPTPKHGIPKVQVNDTAEDSPKPSCLNARKRQRQTEGSETRQSPPGKRFSSSTLTAADKDMLDSYWADFFIKSWTKVYIAGNPAFRWIEMWMEWLMFCCFSCFYYSINVLISISILFVSTEGAWQRALHSEDVTDTLSQLWCKERIFNTIKIISLYLVFNLQWLRY